MAAHEADETVRSARAMPDVEECAQHLVQVGARRSAEGGRVRDGAERSDGASYPRCRACCLRKFEEASRRRSRRRYWRRPSEAIALDVAVIGELSQNTAERSKEAAVAQDALARRVQVSE